MLSSMNMPDGVQVFRNAFLGDIYCYGLSEKHL